MTDSNKTFNNVVNSFNEWDPLEEVIVGSVIGAAKMGYEPALAPFYPPNSKDRRYKGGIVENADIERAQEQLDNFAKILENEGIKVRRPEIINYCNEVKTPDFSISFQNSSACPRDVLLVLGNEIIEAPMAQRARYFEVIAYRSLIKSYFMHGANWTMAPKPRMTDDLYNEKNFKYENQFDEGNSSLTEFEPCFDAASFVRCGKDIFYQPDAVTNDFGALWLQRHLNGKFRIHKMRFKDTRPEHLDTTLVPLEPGLVLVNRERPCIDGSIKIFVDNGWEVIEAPPSKRGPLGYTPEVSNWISMNVLCLGERRVVVEETEEYMIRFLEKRNYTVITCPFSEVYPFGGSFHCCTSDIRRTGKLESYFPSMDAI